MNSGAAGERRAARAMDEGLSQLAAYGSDGSDSEDEEEPPPARASRGVSWASDGALADVVRCPHPLAAERPDGWPCVCVCVLCPWRPRNPRSLWTLRSRLGVPRTSSSATGNLRHGSFRSGGRLGDPDDCGRLGRRPCAPAPPRPPRLIRPRAAHRRSSRRARPRPRRVRRRSRRSTPATRSRRS